MAAPIQDNVLEFARGASFEVIIRLPANVEPDYFKTWMPLAQIRREGNLTKKGLIDDLNFKWLPDTNTFLLSLDDTDKWPLGMAEFDVLFSSNSGRRIRTKTMRIKIRAGATRD